LHGQAGIFAFERLDPRQFIVTHDFFTVLREL
jgi:hypothetical protein